MSFNNSDLVFKEERLHMVFNSMFDSGITLGSHQATMAQVNSFWQITYTDRIEVSQPFKQVWLDIVPNIDRVPPEFDVFEESA